MDEDDKPYSAEDIDAALHEAYGDLLDANQELLWSVRERVRELEEMKKKHIEVIGMLDDAQHLLLAGASVVADSIGNLVVNEWTSASELKSEDTDDDLDEEEEEEDE
jgi:hypothetical protein